VPCRLATAAHGL